jgi:hypothetical protein
MNLMDDGTRLKSESDDLLQRQGGVVEASLPASLRGTNVEVILLRQQQRAEFEECYLPLNIISDMDGSYICNFESLPEKGDPQFGVIVNRNSEPTEMLQGLIRERDGLVVLITGANEQEFFEKIEMGMLQVVPDIVALRGGATIRLVLTESHVDGPQDNEGPTITLTAIPEYDDMVGGCIEDFNKPEKKLRAAGIIESYASRWPELACFNLRFQPKDIGDNNPGDPEKVGLYFDVPKADMLTTTKRFQEIFEDAFPGDKIIITRHIYARGSGSELQTMCLDIGRITKSTARDYILGILGVVPAMVLGDGGNDIDLLLGDDPRIMPVLPGNADPHLREAFFERVEGKPPGQVNLRTSTGNRQRAFVAADETHGPLAALQFARRL